MYLQIIKDGTKKLQEPHYFINNEPEIKKLKYYHAYKDHWNTCGVSSE